MTCRFCKKMDVKAGKLVKYAARHWAHHRCWLEAKSAEIDPTEASNVIGLLSGAFHGWQLRNFPVFGLADWMERKGTEVAGKSWADKAMNVLKKAIAQSEGLGFARAR